MDCSDALLSVTASSYSFAVVAGDSVSAVVAVVKAGEAFFSTEFCVLVVNTIELTRNGRTGKIISPY